MMFDGQIRQIPLQIENNAIIGYCAIGPAETMHRCIFDTGAQITVIPQRFWKQQFRRQDLEKPEYQRVNLRSAYGQTCRARRVPIRIWIMGGGDQDPTRSVENENLDIAQIIDFGICEADLLFDEDAAYAAEVSRRDQELKKLSGAEEIGGATGHQPPFVFEPLNLIYIGLGGGTFRNGGLCINWTKPDAMLIEQVR